MPAREQRRLAAIVAADVVGYSRLMGRDEAGTLSRLKKHRVQRLEPALARNGGRLVKLTGDGALAEFSSAVDALRAAIEFQQAVDEANAVLPEDQRIVFRVGLHVGDLIVEGDDLYGDGVNVAARLEGEAPSGGIVVSGTARDFVEERVKARFADLGELALKNIERPVRAWRIEWDAADWKPAATAAPEPHRPNEPVAPALTLPDKPSIAVLPFQNMSGDAEQEYFVDGLVEDIITALSRISWFFVIARNSSFVYKGKAVDVRQVGRDLGVRYVLEGSVRKAGSRIRITGQLIDTLGGAHVWADRFEGAVEDVFELQDRMTSSIVGSIEPKVQQAEIARAQAKPTTDLTAYDLFLRATALMAEFKEERHREALALLERAVAQDPRFSSAHALMANLYMNRKSQGWGSIDDAEARGLAAAQIAIETGQDDPAALTRIGMALSYLAGRHEEGRAHIERALSLNPNLAVAWRYLAYSHWYLGDFDRAIECFDNARRFSPVDPGASDGYTGLGMTYFLKGHFEEALEWIDKALRERPRWVPAHWIKVAASAMAGRSPGELRRAVEALQVAEPGTSIGKIMRRFPIAEGPHRQAFEAALGKAGLPE